MARHQCEREHPPSAQRVDLRQRVELGQQHQRDGNRAEAADARVLHDFEHALPVAPAAEAIDRIGKTILVEGAGDQQRRCHAGQDRQRNRQPLSCGDGDRGADRADDHADQRQIARGLLELLLRVADLARHRQPAEEAQRGEEDRELAIHARFETPADSKLAISSRKAQAALSSG